MARLEGKKLEVEIGASGLCECTICLKKPIYVACKFLSGDDGLYEIYAEPEDKENSSDDRYQYRVTIKSMLHGNFYELESGKGIFKQNCLTMEDGSKLKIDTRLNLWKPFKRDCFQKEAIKLGIPEKIANSIS